MRGLLRNRLFRVASCCALLTVLNGCGSPKTFDDSVRVVPRMSEQHSMVYVNAWSSGDAAVALEQRVLAYVGALTERRKQDFLESLRAAETERTPIPTSAASAPTSSHTINWDCVSIAETGGDWQMHGSRYSTALGIMNQAVRENATEAVANRVFTGTASREEQIQIGESIVRKFGFDAWAPSTVAKCS